MSAVMVSKNHLHVTATVLLLAAIAACSSDDDTSRDDGATTPSTTVPAPVTAIEAGDASVEADAAAETFRFALAARADDAPSTSTHLVAVDLATGTVAGDLTQDGNASVHASSGRAFLIDADRDRFVALDEAKPWTAAWTHEPASDDAPTTNAIVASTSHAYVLRETSNEIEILSLADGSHAGSVDLSSFVDPLDTDGLVDVSDGFYDGATGRVYVVLPRNRPHQPQQRCSGGTAVVVGIDAATRSLVDLNGAADGAAIELAGQWPARWGGGIAVEKSGLVAYVVDAGCYDDAGTLTGAGVERIDLVAGSSSLVVTSNVTVPLAKLLHLDEHHAFVQVASTQPLWKAWDPTATAFGSFENGIPSVAAVAAGPRVIGLAERGADTGTTLDVVAFDPTTRKQSFVTQDALDGASRMSASVVVVK